MLVRGPSRPRSPGKTVGKQNACRLARGLAGPVRAVFCHSNASNELRALKSALRLW